MVELIDDDDVEEVRFQLLNAEGGQRLDRGEDVFPLTGVCAPRLKFAEGAVLHHVAVRAHGLVEDFLAVRDEEQFRFLPAASQDVCSPAPR